MKSGIIKTFLLALLLIFTGCSIEGNITNKEGKALANAKVIATYEGNLTQETQSDKFGTYTIDGISSGTDVKISVSKEGYFEQSKNISAGNDTVYLDFELESNGEVVIPVIEKIVGRFVNDKGEAVKGHVDVVDGYGFTSSTGDFQLRKYTNADVLFNPSDTVTLRFRFSIGSLNQVHYERTYVVNDFLDVNNSSYMNIGDIVVKQGSVKGCAKNLVGLNFGTLVYSYAEDSQSGISFDDYFNETPKHIYNDDKGMFEFPFYIDNKEHVLVLRDSLGNTNSMTFLADKSEVDLRDSCLRVKFKKKSLIKFTATVDSNESIGSVRIIPLYDEEVSIEAKNGEFSLKSSGQYLIEFTATTEMTAIERANLGRIHLQYTLDFKDKKIKGSTYFTLPNANNHLFYSSRFGVYQGNLVQTDLILPSSIK